MSLRSIAGKSITVQTADDHGGLRTENQETIVKIWRNGIIPVIFRCALPPEVRVKLPFATDNRVWIQPAHTQVRWDKHRKCWIVANNRFSTLVQGCLHRYGKVYVVQQRKELEKCAPACWNAIGIDCECSCGGTNHGCGDDDGWHRVDDAFAFRWHSVGYSCRLIEPRVRRHECDAETPREGRRAGTGPAANRATGYGRQA